MDKTGLVGDSRLALANKDTGVASTGDMKLGPAAVNDGDIGHCRGSNGVSSADADADHTGVCRRLLRRLRAGLVLAVGGGGVLLETSEDRVSVDVGPGDTGSVVVEVTVDVATFLVCPAGQGSGRFSFHTCGNPWDIPRPCVLWITPRFNPRDTSWGDIPWIAPWETWDNPGAIPGLKSDVILWTRLLPSGTVWTGLAESWKGLQNGVGDLGLVGDLIISGLHNLLGSGGLGGR